MSFLDSLLSNVAGSGAASPDGQSATNPLGAVLASLAGGNQQQSGNLLAAAMSLLQQNAGLAGVLDKLQSSGLGTHADSWVGTGSNMPVSGDQLQQALGASALANIASQLGMSPAQASSAMAQILPELINQLTPNGRIPNNVGDLLSQGLSMLQR